MESSYPLLEKLPALYTDTHLQGTVLIALQHINQTTCALFEKLLEKGAAPEWTFVLGKCYSTDPVALKRLQNMGIYVDKNSFHFNSHEHYDATLRKNAYNLMQHAVKVSSRLSHPSFLLLDEGGYLIDFAENMLPKNAPIAGVEQTSSGFHKLQSQKLAFPIINVARSWVKLQYETPMVIDVAMHSWKKIEKTQGNRIKNVLLLGFGVVGKALFSTLRKKYYTRCFDIDPTCSSLSHTELLSSLSSWDVILGTTGTTSFPYVYYDQLKKPVILASLSSSDREFDAVMLRKTQPLYQNPHVDLNVSGIHLINSGFPITFTQDYKASDAPCFQLTRALLFAGLMQAKTSLDKPPGIYPLDEEVQKRIVVLHRN